MSFHPQTPQSPSQFSSGAASDPVTSAASSMAATTATTLPTPAHSVNGSSSQLDIAMSDESPNKRKRSVDDMGDRDHKKVHLEESKLGIEDLHLDVGKKYLLCQTRKTPLAAFFPLPPLPPRRGGITRVDGGVFNDSCVCAVQRTFLLTWPSFF